MKQWIADHINSSFGFSLLLQADLIEFLASANEDK
jgi:hypothetical protein